MVVMLSAAVQSVLGQRNQRGAGAVRSHGHVQRLRRLEARDYVQRATA